MQWSLRLSLLAALALLASCCPKQPAATSPAEPLAAAAAAPAPVARPGAPARSWPANHTVLTGLDVLERENFARLTGRKVGLIANHTALNRKGEHLLDLVLRNPSAQIVALYSPEHGFRGTADEEVASGIEQSTGLPLFSLYGDTNRPNDTMLQGVDTLVFDIQDIGARFYTYTSTMAICMEEAKKRGIRFYVLDRPNPLGGFWFDGPIQDADLNGRLTSYFPMPTAHGMTVGELATLFNTHYGIGCELEVVRMEGWYRDMFYDETGLPWANPSPNMRSLDEELLYMIAGQTENTRTGLSVGRGTDRPFEYLGAPWIKGADLAAELRARNIPGRGVSATTLMPYDRDVTGRKFTTYPHVNKECGAVRFSVSNRWALRPVEAGIELIAALHKLYPDTYDLELTRGSVGSQWVLDAIKAGQPAGEIAKKWRESPEFKEFAKAREKVLFYGMRGD